MAVVILGGGVSGLTTGICLAEAGISVKIRAPEVAETTLSVAAGAIWGPYLVEPGKLVEVWGGKTLEVLRELAVVPGTGVTVPTGVMAARQEEEAPAWSTQLDDFVECGPGELPAGFVKGWRFSAPVVNMVGYLRYLLQRFIELGGVVERQRAETIEDAAGGADVDAVVNCTGIYARELVADTSLVAVRGQTVIVENPGISEFFVEERGEDARQVYWFPQGDVVVLGGSLEVGVWSLHPDPEVAERIRRDCVAIEPRLEHARVVGHRVGLRPMRPAVRVEREEINGVPVVHNYGHGGAGVSVSWGCAAAARDLVVESLRSGA